MNELPFAELLGPSSTPPPVEQLRPVGSRRVAVVLPTLDPSNGPPGWGARWGLGLAGELGRSSQWSAEVLSTGAPGMESLSTGVTHRTLQSATPLEDGAVADRLSWEFGRAISDVDAVVVSQPFTRQAEAVILVAKALGKVAVAIDSGLRTSAVGASLGLLALMDGTLCHSRYGASLLPTDSRATAMLGGVDHRFFTPGEEPSQGTRDSVRCLIAGIERPDDILVETIAQELPRDADLVISSETTTDRPPGTSKLKLGTVTLREVERATPQQLRELYCTAHVTIVAPAREDAVHYEMEQLSLIGLESMACGTPVVVSSSHPFAEYVDDGITGIISRDDQIAEAVHGLLEDRSLGVEMGHRARRKVEQEYGVDSTAHYVTRMLSQRLPGGGTP